MDVLCKHCGGAAFMKRGFVRGKQRYFCKICERHFTLGDGREKYSPQIREAAITLYLEGCGFRRIARILRKIYAIRIHGQLIIYWVKRLGLKLEDAISEKVKSRKIPLLEMDELYSYIKKNQI